MVMPARPDQIRGITYTSDLQALAASTAALLEAAGDLDDAACRAPSALPGWSRGHVLTHLARNADGMRNLCIWAITGDETPMYASREARAADIEAGAGRSADALRSDLAQASAMLADALAGVPVASLEVPLRLGSGAAVTAWEMPRLRRREVEIHRADLGLGYGPDDWPVDFATTALDGLAPATLEAGRAPVGWLSDGEGRVWTVGREGPTLVGPRGQLLAWLAGRGTGPELRLDPPGSVPESPAWV